MSGELPELNISKASRAESISEAVKEAIFSGYWMPGARIDDQELARKLEVSRLSVREALAKLVETGIVERRHWKGYQVRSLSWHEVDSILEVREALELLAIRKLVRARDPEILRELEEALAEAEQRKSEGRVVEFRRADFRFHEILYRASGNAWIADILGNLRILIELLRFISQSEDFEVVASASIREHRRILARLSGEEPRGAVAEMRSHLRSHRERVRMRFSASTRAPSGT